MRRRWRTVTTADATLAVERTVWGDGGGGPIVMSHATGFCKEVMHPLVDAIAATMAGGTIESYDHRNHGASSKPGPLETWWPLGRDAAAVTTAAGARAIGVGHSCGGAALAYGEILRPGTFAGLVLVDPILFPAGERGPLEERLVRTALRRKPGFATRAEAIENFEEKPVFAGWLPDALAGYVAGGLRPGGDGVELSCRPEHEANFFAVSRTDSGWERLGEVRCPVTIVHGERSDTHQPDVVKSIAARFASSIVDTVMVPDTSHFVPMEQPEAVADVVVGMVRGTAHD